MGEVKVTAFVRVETTTLLLLLPKMESAEADVK